jgi:hypothetical protein
MLCQLSQSNSTHASRYTEVIDLLSRAIITNVTDLDTLRILAEHTAMNDFALLSGVPNILQKGISRLSITLRLPLEFFQSLEAQQTRHDGQTWLQICSTPFFGTLTSLTLWLDHTSTSTWSLVNERSFLHPLLDALLPTNVQVVIILPKLHPLHECPDRHFLTTRIGKKAYVYRKLRQRYRSRDDCLVVVHVPDYPYFLDFYENLSLAEVEEYERAGWEKGHDMELFAEMERIELDRVCPLGLL